jgi:hypothetical protein
MIEVERERETMFDVTWRDDTRPYVDGPPLQLHYPWVFLPHIIVSPPL